MTVISEILKNLSKNILSHPSWEHTPIHYHKNTVIPEKKFPCIVIEAKGIKGENRACFVDIKRDIEVSLYMNEKDVKVALNKVWNFEENILKNLTEEYFAESLHPNVDWFKYIGTDDVKTLEVKQVQGKGSSEWQSIADFLTVTFELKYNI